MRWGSPLDHAPEGRSSRARSALSTVGSTRIGRMMQMSAETGSAEPRTRGTTSRRAVIGAALQATAIAGVAAACAPGGSPSTTPRKEPAKLWLSTDWTTGIRGETVKRWVQEGPKAAPAIREVEIWTAPAEG